VKDKATRDQREKMKSEILDRIATESHNMLQGNDIEVYSLKEGKGISGLKGISGKV
jgi:hypothetical protein